MNDFLSEKSGVGGGIIYLDLARLPKAYQIRGRYEITEGKVKVRCRVFKDDLAIGDLIKVEGETGNDLEIITKKNYMK